MSTLGDGFFKAISGEPPNVEKRIGMYLFL